MKRNLFLEITFLLWYNCTIVQLYISSNWLVEVVWSRQLFIKYNSTLLISETVQIFNNNFEKWKTRRLLLFNLYGKTFFFFWQYNSLLALLWGECPVNLCPAFDAFLSSIYLYIHCFQNNKNQYPNVYDWLILSGCL